MRKHVPFKSIIRQPIRTLIFVLLVGLASFGFVSRAVEYIILNREMNRIEQFYRSVGTLVPLDPSVTNNVYQAAEIIGNSRFIEFEDRRTITQGVMDGILNAMQSSGSDGVMYSRGEPIYSYKGLYTCYSIVIINVERIAMRFVRPPWGGTDLVSVRTLTVRFHDVLFGQNPFLAVRQYMAEFEMDEEGNSLIDEYDLQEGGFYLARVIQQRGLDPQNTSIDIFPLYDDVHFVDVRDADAMAQAWRAMADDIPVLEANNSMLMLTGTKDMTALPLVQTGVYERFQGRFITYEDYQNANPVIVIPQRMDSVRRDARVGETITLTLRDMRTFIDGSPMPQEDHRMFWRIPEGAEAHWRNIPAGYWVSIPNNYEGDWRNYPTVEIEVEIIGTYFISDRWDLPRWAHIDTTFQNMEVFVPASIIPEGWGIVDTHLVSGAYSFVLTSPDADIPFMAEYGEILTHLGFGVQFMGEDPTNFLQSAVPIRNSIRINLLLFSAVLAVVLILTVFLFLRQRYKEFAILRALGITRKYSTWQVVMPVLIFWLPIVIGASIGAWYFAMHQAAESLRILAEIGTPTDYGMAFVVRNILEQLRYEAEQEIIRTTPQLSIVYLMWLCVGLILTWVGAVLAGVVSFSGRSMISLIQGVNNDGARMRVIKETAPPQGVTMSNIEEILQISPARSSTAAIKSNVRHHSRHVFRSPVKTILVLGMALLFIASLGWLDRTITFTEQEIERLYTTTVITGQIVNPAAGMDAAIWGHEIPDSSLEILRGSGMAEDIYVTAVSRVSLFPPWPEDWEVDENTHEIDGNVLINADITKTFSDWDTLMRDINRPAAFGVGFGGDFEIDFAPGFGPEDFVFDWWADVEDENVNEDDVNENDINEHDEEHDEEDDEEHDEEEWEAVERSFGVTFGPDGRILQVITETDAEDRIPVDIEPIPVIVHESLLTRTFMVDAGVLYSFTVSLDNQVVWDRVGDNVLRYILDENGWAVPQTLSLGDRAYLLSQWWHGQIAQPVIIAGVYRGGHPGVAYRMGQGLILTHNHRRFRFWSTATFSIYPDKLPYLYEFVEDMNSRLTYQIHTEWFNFQWGEYRVWTESFNHVVELNDDEFRAVVIPLEENLNLLRILYPAAQILSFVLALGLSLLLMLQNAKIVAILRVLGSSRHKTRFNLGLEQLAVCIIGVVVGFIVILVLGVGIGTAAMLAGIYLSGAAIGTIAGVLVISYKTPLELLQVRE